MLPTIRDLREIVRDEPLMRRRILAAIRDRPLTVPEIAEEIDAPTSETLIWVMGMRRYGWLAEVKGAADDGFFRYEPTGRVS